MFDLIVKNLFTLYLGASIRFVWFRIILRRKVSFDEILNGVENKKANYSEKELDNMRSGFMNRVVGVVFIMILILLIVYLSDRRII